MNFRFSDADAGQVSVNGNDNDNYPRGGSGSINALIDHSGFRAATATDASTLGEHGTIQASAGNDSNRGQSQRDLHAAEDGSAAAKQYARHDRPGHDSDHGQSQRDLHASEDSFAAAEQLAKHDATLENEANRGQSRRDFHAGPVNAASNLHLGSSLNAGGKDQPTDDAGRAETAAAPAFGDSFHFKKEMGASKATDVVELDVGHALDSTEHGLHTAGPDGRAPIQDADLVGLSLAEQNAVDHAKRRWATRLREISVKAPLQSLFVALLLGVWVGRGRRTREASTGRERTVGKGKRTAASRPAARARLAGNSHPLLRN